MTASDKPWFVYLVRCRDGTIYTGITTDVEERVRQHNSGKGARYTAQRRPVTLLYSEAHLTQGSALRRELRLKSLNRANKERLVSALR